MRFAIVIPVICTLAAPLPASSQRAPTTRLLDRIPPIFGSGPNQPGLVIPSTPVMPGLTAVADHAKPGDAVGFDLGGFRLGMSEAQVDAVVRTRHMTPGIITRGVDFESSVRSLINTRGGAGGEETHRGVLSEANVEDDAGGRYTLRMLTWPDGAHLYDIVYVAAQGTAAAEWRRMLVGKWGRPRTDDGGSDLTARWGATTPAGFRATVRLGSDGGTILLQAPEGSAERPYALVAQAADAFFSTRARKPAL
ncbi:hypothetical protein [Sphingomonas sp. CFBP 8760]|uniref:hypothetical protein n=1 Tax=Sphingomonas sp. CFBP 8760 TaxID=2775282 RepID=UPI00177E75B6|nr:hypothetical protein [Sphingomonas sp. CFBP 8760]MBD8546729.1 hypothetical protein [Sphingomonas sp. CFBP 8760]